jgi:hypothetical protein
MNSKLASKLTRAIMSTRSAHLFLFPYQHFDQTYLSSLFFAGLASKLPLADCVLWWRRIWAAAPLTSGCELWRHADEFVQEKERCDNIQSMSVVIRGHEKLSTLSNAITFDHFVPVETITNMFIQFEQND